VSKRKSRPQPSQAPARAAETTQIEIGPLAVGAALVLVALLVGVAWWLLRGGGPATQAVVPAAGPTGLAGAGSAAGSAAPGSTSPGMPSSAGTTAEGDPFIGDAAAPVTIVAYSDYRCPNCRQFATEVLPWLKQGWLGQGFVRVVFRDFPVRGDASYVAAHAAHCAGEQGRYWDFHDRLFEDLFGVDLAKAAIGREALRQAAVGLGLDADALDACMQADRYRARIEASDKSARGQGFEGTPTFLVNGRKTQGAIPVADWERLFQLYQQELGQSPGQNPGSGNEPSEGPDSGIAATPATGSGATP
jgi:protein-disulfide isomerase